MNSMLIAGLAACPFLALAACLYLANGQLRQPESLKEWLFPRPAPCGQQGNEGFEKKSLAERWQRLKSEKWLQVLWLLATVLGAAFYAFRQTAVIAEPALNLKYLVLLYLFFAAAVIDLQLYIIPNALVGAGAGIWLALTGYSVIAEKADLLFLLMYSLVGFLFGGGVLVLCRLLMKNSLGFGDVKIMAVTGAICGFYKTFNILFYGLLICSVYAVCLLLFKKADRKAEVPLAPFLLAGLVAANLIAA